MSVVACVIKHLGRNSPIGAYRADLSEDVAELVAGGMGKEAAWLQVIDEKSTNLKGEKARIEQSVADAYAKTAAGKPAPEPEAEPEAQAVSASGAAAPKPKVYKTKTDAQIASKSSGNAKRVKKIAGGFILRDASDKELTAAQAAGKRLTARKAVDRNSDPLLTAIAKLGGLAMSEKADTIGEGNKNTAGGFVFTMAGKPIDTMAGDLAELNYIPADEMERDGGTTWLRDAIKAENMGTRQHFSEAGESWMEKARADAEAHYDVDPLADLTSEDLQDDGYIGATPAIQQATEELIAAAEALGVDVDTIRENADSATRGQTDDQYQAAVQRLAREAIASAGRNAQGADAQGSGEGSRDSWQAAGAQGEEQSSEGLTLEAQSPADLREKAAREAAAADDDKKEQARIKRADDKAREGREFADRTRQDASADGFELGQSRADVIKAMAGNGDMFADAPQAESQATATKAMDGPRRDPTQVNALRAPYNSGDIVAIGGKNWMVKSDTPGWYLSSDGTWRGEHPTVKGIKSQVELIRAVEEAAESATPSAAEKAAPGKLDNFGEALPPSRRQQAAAMDKTLSDDDIANRPLSEIWPLAENEAIEDKFTAAVSHAARAEVPAKPRKGYKLDRWVQSVKTVRNLAKLVISRGVTPEQFKEKAGNALEGFVSKVTLLNAIDRTQWKRIGTVREMPKASTFEDGKSIGKPMVAVEVDGKNHWLNGSGSVADHLDKINELLGEAVQDKKMAFEVRGSGSKFFINKKGDSEYRHLMDFSNAGDASKARREKYDELVKAWDAVKARDNVTEADTRSDANRDRVGPDYRKGRDITGEEFDSTFGFKGGEFGAWVSQGAGARERQWMLNRAYDAMMDLAEIVGVPPKALSLNGTMGIAFGSRGTGRASAHFEPNNLVINLTKTNGAGALAHEWFHALDNYFSRARGGEVPMSVVKTADGYRKANFVTYKPEPLMVRKDGTASRALTKGKLEAYRKANPTVASYAASAWMPDPLHPAGVRPEVEERFADLVEALDAAPMTKRASIIDKGKSEGYWSQIIERAARSFESYVIHRMQEKGQSNEYLANVTKFQDFARDKGRYPYPTPSEIKPVADAFGALFDTIQTRTDDAGNVAMFSRAPGVKSALGKAIAAKEAFDAMDNAAVVVADADAYFDLSEKASEARDALAAQLGKQADDGFALQGRTSLGRMVIVNASAQSPGQWQLTRFDGNDEPLGDSQYDTKESAVADFLREIDMQSLQDMDGAFDRSGSQAGTKSDISRVTNTAEAIASLWANAPDVVVFGSMQDDAVPASVRARDAQQRSQGATGDPRAFYAGGKVYLHAGMLKTPMDVAEALFHESLGHAGLRGHFGPGLDRVLDQMSKLYDQGALHAKAIEYGQAVTDKNGKFVRYSSEQARRTTAEEVLAELAQTRPTSLWVQKAIAAIRTFLREHIPGFADMKLTDAEVIRSFLAPARGFIERGGPAQERSGSGMMLSRAKANEPATESPDAWIYRFWSSRTWDSEADAKTMIRRRMVEDNERYAGSFAPNAPSLVDGLVFVAAPKGQVRLKQPRAKPVPFDRIGEPADSDSDGADRPRVDWTSRDLADDGTADSVLQAYGRGKGNVYRAWLDPSLIPAPKGSGIVGGYPDNEGDYDWRELAGRGEPPPLKIRVGANGKIVLMDGNHRLAWWREQGRAEVPAFVIDERRGASDVMFSRATGAGPVSAQDALWDIVKSANTPAKGRAVFMAATENINRFNLWDKTIGTMLNMARKNPHFARVFEAFQQQQDDTAAFAIEAEAEAVDVLARMGDRKEVMDSLKSTISGERSADLHAVSKAIFSNIEGEQGVKQKVFTDAQLAQDFKLNERQIGQYRQARAAIDQSLDRYAQSLVVRAAQKFVGTEDFRRGGLDETVEEVMGRLNFRRDQFVDARDSDPLFGAMDLGGLPEKEKRNITHAKAVALLTEKIQALDAAIEQIPAIQKTANDLKAAGYAPAMRFGDYAVTANGRDGTVEFFAMVDTKLQANVLRMQLRQEFPTAAVTANAVDKESFKIFGGMSPDTVELFAKFMEVDKTEAFKEFVALAASSRSALKHMLERKGVAGFSQKLPQVLSAFITSNSRAAARNLNGEELAAAMKSVQDNARGDVSEQAAKLYNYMQNPTDDGAKIRGFMFAYFMGGSVASALVNLTQPLMMTTPYLHQFAGNKVAAIMVRAAKTAATGETPNAALKAAMVKANAEGVTDTHEYYQMMQEAGGSGNVPVRAAMKAWGAMFGAAEKFNRKITFAAAFEVAQGMAPEQIKEAGAGDAYSFAKRAVDETQGVYARHNRPTWARGTAGALLMTFKQFSISYIEFFMRLPTQQKLVAIALLMMMAGAEGLPFAEDLEDLIDTLGQKMGYATNTKKTLHQAATAALGEAGAQFALHGISGLSGLPMDVAGRLGIGNLLPGTKMFNPSAKDKAREVMEIAGPAGGMAQKMLDAVDQNDPSRAFPSAMANAYKALDMIQTGQYRDSKNKRVQDVDAMDAAMKLIGFQPQSVAAGSRRIAEDMRDVDTVRRVEAEIVSQWADAIRARDQEAVKDARQRLADWNDDNPELPIRIKMQQIVAKVKAANLTRDQRFMKTAPPEIRRKLMAEAE